MIGFQLGREFRLSIAEILSVFTNVKIINYTSDYLIIDWVSIEEALKKSSELWWSIKIMEIFPLENTSFEERILDFASETEWKFKYWITSLWDKFNLKTTLLKLKKELKTSWISSRFVNKDFKWLNSATIIWENLVKRKGDFSLLINKSKEFLWRTIWIQDIDAYSKRDYAKSRDMQIGMLPPKLSQMMINLSEWEKTIYDPFVWLWTILIEANLMWFDWLYWSDLNPKMVETSTSNTNWIIEKLNAKFVNEASFWDSVKNWVIVSEWYLWEVMTQKNISKDRILGQRKGLEKLYIAFFENLKKWWFSWNIVISFPFWEVKGNYYYFEEIYSILEEMCEILPFFPEDFNLKETKTWSLLYKREKQLVGREIFKLKIK
jgi:tRNA G10  N-methylase Trm11